MRVRFRFPSLHMTRLGLSDSPPRWPTLGPLGAPLGAPLGPWWLQVSGEVLASIEGIRSSMEHFQGRRLAEAPRVGSTARVVATNGDPVLRSTTAMELLDQGIAVRKVGAGAWNMLELDMTRIILSFFRPPKCHGQTVSPRHGA